MGWGRSVCRTGGNGVRGSACVGVPSFRTSSRRQPSAEASGKHQVTVIVTELFRAGSLRFLFLWIEARFAFPCGWAFLSPRLIIPGPDLHRLSALRPVPPPVSHLAALLCLDRASVLPPSFDFSVASALGFQPAFYRSPVETNVHYPELRKQAFFVFNLHIQFTAFINNC